MNNLKLLFIFFLLACSSLKNDCYNCVKITGIVKNDAVHYGNVLFDKWPFQCDIDKQEIRYYTDYLKTILVFMNSKSVIFELSDHKRRIKRIQNNYNVYYMIGYGIVKRNVIIIKKVIYIKPIPDSVLNNDDFLLSSDYCISGSNK